MATYKISYVVRGTDHPGGIVNKDSPLEIGETFKVGNVQLKVLEVVELMPPRGEFYYLHATCEKVEQN
jgi:hypothetical protein